MLDIENITQLKLNFTKIASLKTNSLLPVVIQDANSKDVLLLAYINQKALEISLKTKILTLWSSSRNKLWIKGETSKNTFAIKKIMVNCEQNSLLFLVTPNKQGICHTKNSDGKYRQSCFYRELDFSSSQLKFIE